MLGGEKTKRGFHTDLEDGGKKKQFLNPPRLGNQLMLETGGYITI